MRIGELPALEALDLLDLFTLAGTVRRMNEELYNQLTLDELRGA